MSGYVIERQDVRRGGWTTLATVDPLTHSYKVQKLLEGQEYHFRVLAENQVGVGTAFETQQPIEVRSPYGECGVLMKVSAFVRIIIHLAIFGCCCC